MTTISITEETVQQLATFQDQANSMLVALQRFRYDVEQNLSDFAPLYGDLSQLVKGTERLSRSIVEGLEKVESVQFSVEEIEE